MRPRSTVLFIIGVLGTLGVLSVVFPRDGVEVCGHRWLFPSIAEVINVAPEDTTPSLTPEELLEMRLAEVLAAREDAFQTYTKESPARFYFPGDDSTYFDALYEALEDCQGQSVRIVHYGDSQLEEDRITSYLRERFQSQFGGSGVGMMAAVPKSRGTYTLTHSIEG
ncbi:MAG: hypothetical protein HUK03_06205, partial [Bacteroidaceae bacterium]|nr:hypothetical protein [Bacteroidaceae bacterium]